MLISMRAEGASGWCDLVPPYEQNNGSIKSCPQGHPEMSSQVSFKQLPDKKRFPGTIKCVVSFDPHESLSGYISSLPIFKDKGGIYQKVSYLPQRIVPNSYDFLFCLEFFPLGNSNSSFKPQFSYCPSVKPSLLHLPLLSAALHALAPSGPDTYLHHNP